MSATLPGNFILPATREMAHLANLVGGLSSAERVEAVVHLEFARQSLQAGMAELRDISLVKPAIDEWSRRSFASLSKVFNQLVALLKSAGVVDAMRADIDQQRVELRAFLEAHHLAAQADWALVATLMAVEALYPLLQTLPMPTPAEFDAAVAQVDFADSYGSSLRVVCFLTHVLEAARAGEPFSERHATFVSLAFLEAVAMVSMIGREMGKTLDPMPYLVESRGAVARHALLRLLQLPRDEVFAASVNSARAS